MEVEAFSETSITIIEKMVNCIPEQEVWFQRSKWVSSVLRPLSSANNFKPP
jgi:hypothetical protein